MDEYKPFIYQSAIHAEIKPFFFGGRLIANNIKNIKYKKNNGNISFITCKHSRLYKTIQNATILHEFTPLAQRSPALRL